MTNLFDTLFTVIVGTLTGVSRAISSTVGGIQDFFLVRVAGMPFIVLGARQVGKTTMIEWLRNNMDSLDAFAPDPTAAGGDEVPDFTARLDGDAMKLRPVRDVGGEAPMWETDWVELFREAQPRGIIFILDHTDPYPQKDAFNFVMQMIEEEQEASKHLRAFFVLINKEDLWADESSAQEIEDRYRNEKRRLITLADRRDFKWAMAPGSLMTGRGVRPFIKQFFNTIRPQRQRITG